MSVLIRGMELPKGCHFCPMAHWTSGTDEFSGCEVVPGKKHTMFEDEAYANSPTASRPDWCPLHALHPHGRLIDADALLDIIKSNAYPVWHGYNEFEYGMTLYGIQQAISEALTAIPADGIANQ